MTGAVPKLRFAVFDSAWRAERLSKGISLISGQHLGPDDYSREEGGTPYFTGPSDFTNDEKALTKWTHARAKTAVRGDVLITVKGSGVGELMLLDLPEVAMGRQLMAIRSKGFSADLLSHILKGRRQTFQALAAGNMIPGLSRDDILTLKVALPDSPEQQKIAAFLGAVDSKLAALRRKQAGLERFKAGLMQRLFSQKLRFTQDDGSAFPDWEEKRLGDVVTWQRNNNLAREFASEMAGDVQNIHYGDIHGRFSNLFRQSEAEAPFIAGHAPIKDFKKEDFCRAGDIVFADASEDYADIGKAIELLEVRKESLVAGLHTHLARPKSGKFALGFVGYMVRVESVRTQIMKAAQGISVLGISKGNLEMVLVPIPHPDEQRKIADALTALDTKIAATAAQITKIERFKQGLLQQMFV